MLVPRSNFHPPQLRHLSQPRRPLEMLNDSNRWTFSAFRVQSSNALTDQRRFSFRSGSGTMIFRV